MNFIIYDLEFNQKSPNDDIVPNLSFEVIQIGALKLDENLNSISTFNSFVKPTLYHEIHPYVESLTNITSEKVNSSRTFPEIYKDFLDFIGDEDYVLCTWGSADIKELIKNIDFHKLKDNLIPCKHIDVQKLASIYTKTPKGMRIGLRTAIDFFQITIEGDFHDAFNDAFYTAEVFKKLYTKDIEPTFYNTPPLQKRVSEPKKKIDTKALINQFEKMYNREMTDEEKDIIKLSYIMGKTNQFLT